jgi:hypothetical protein
VGFIRSRGYLMIAETREYGYSSRLSGAVLVGGEGGPLLARGLACAGATRQRVGLTSSD